MTGAAQPVLWLEHVFLQFSPFYPFLQKKKKIDVKMFENGRKNGVCSFKTLCVLIG